MTVQAGAYLYSLNGDQGTPDTSAQPSGTGTESDPFNVAGAVKKAEETGTTPTDDEYYIRGIVKADATIDATNKNVTLFLVDEGYDAVFQAYRIKSFGGADFFGNEQFKAGDEVVVKGKIVNYNSSTPEIHFKAGEYNGQLVSVNGENSFGDIFSVESTEIPVGATATEAVIKVLANVAWTAESSTATLDKSEGEGSADITVTFDANTDTENTKTYTVTLRTDADVTDKEIVVTITQAKANAAGTNVVEFTFDNAEGIDITTSGKECSSTIDGVTLHLESGARNANAQDIRIYKGKKMTISVSSGTITDIAFTSAGGDNGLTKFGAGAPDGYSAASDGKTAEWTGSQTSVEFTATDAQVRMKSITVTFVVE